MTEKECLTKILECIRDDKVVMLGDLAIDLLFGREPKIVIEKEIEKEIVIEKEIELKQVGPNMPLFNPDYERWKDY